jgi:DNA topoisomerase I
MSKSLVIVESPAKAKTIEKYLGKGYEVLASVGHIMDLPKNELGVELEKRTFEPTLDVSPGKEKVVAQLKKAAAKADHIFLAPDPDREGEAIAYHLALQLGKTPEEKKKIRRVTFNEITKKAVNEAFNHARDLDYNLIDAQQTRRVLDRLVGYQISPLLWDKVRRGLSAGRVQTVAVRLIVEREREISAFQPVEYWTLDAILQTPESASSALQSETFTARFIGVNGEPARVANGKDKDGKEQFLANAVPDEATARAIVDATMQAQWSVRSVEKKERRKFSAPPFTTSALQQQASSRLGFNVRRTMGVAQRLYEGVDLGPDGTTGLITYMRSDSTRVSPDAIVAAREYIGKEFGGAYLPAQPNTFKSKKDAQDAHEAIRPTDPSRHPDGVKRFLSDEQFKLYRLIWQRFTASQMTPAVYDVTTVEIDAVNSKAYNFRVSGSVLKFDGFLRVYQVDDDEEGILPEIPNGAKLLLATAKQLKQLAEQDRAEKLERARKKYAADVARIETRNERARDGAELEPIPAFAEPEIASAVRSTAVDTAQKFTEPPPRFNEASLVKVLEERGIGRPSTYASIISTIQDREYVTKIANRFYPTEIGMVVCDLLVKNFPYIFDTQYTAKLETELDDIEDGKEKWTDLLKGFYGYFEDELKEAEKHMESIKRMEVLTDEKCELCGSPLVLKWGKFGSFYACSAYNKKDPTSCTFTKENTANKPDLNTPEAQEATEQEEYCENCGKVMIMRRGPFGMFLACPDYNADPPCKTFRKLSQKQQQKQSAPQPTGEACPQCGKPLVLRQGAYGEFVSCSGYPKCKYVKQNIIEGLKCPKCGTGDIAERKARRGNLFWGCTNYPKCDFTSNYKPVAEKCPDCGNAYLVERIFKDGVYLICPNRGEKPAETEVPAAKSPALKTKARGKKAAEPEPTGVAAYHYSRRIGDVPPPPTAETHGPVAEGEEKKELQPA